MFEEWKKKLNDIEKEILNFIYQNWKKNGVWPNSLKLLVKFRDKGNLYKIADSFGFRFMHFGHPQQKDDVAKLSIYGIALCDDSENDIDLILKIKDYFLNIFIENPVDIEILSIDIKNKFDLNDDEAKRICSLIFETHKLSSGGGKDQNENYTFRVSYDILKLENVKTIDEFYKAIEGDYLSPRFGGKEEVTSVSQNIRLVRDINQYSQDNLLEGESEIYIPNLDFIVDSRIKTLMEKDLDELNKTLQVGAWKTSTIIAGSIAESLLYYLFKQNETVAKRNIKGWPDKVNLYDMVDVAFKYNLISEPDLPFYNILRIYRNQIHPGKSFYESRPDEFVAIGLSSFVFKLIKNANEEFQEKTK